MFQKHYDKRQLACDVPLMIKGDTPCHQKGMA
jgi:hypothetical protein